MTTSCWSLYPQTQIFQAHTCTNILEELTVNAQNSLKNRCRYHLILHFDKVKPYTSKRTLQKIEELQWEKLSILHIPQIYHHVTSFYLPMWRQNFRNTIVAQFMSSQRSSMIFAQKSHHLCEKMSSTLGSID